MHFLMQAISTMAPSKIIMIIKNLTTKEIYKRYPEIKKLLWGENFWTSGYFVNTAGVSGSER